MLTVCSQVLDAHCGFLSNFEVLQLLQEDVAEQDVHVKALKEKFAQMKKKRYNQDQAKAEPYLDFQDQLTKIVPHNVRTLQVEVSSNGNDLKSLAAGMLF